ncbi:MAG: quinone oxidoreductase [Hyphomicrobiales bacterium]|nr:quinone oxidoreductase [Hyphomicrobiales bacterium]
MIHAIRVHAYGGPEALQWEQVGVAAPGPGEVRLRHRAVGLNYIDVYHRTGLYPQPSFPFTPGTEGAGDVVAVGGGVTEFAPGDRVAYAGPIGAYAEERVIPADRLVKLSPGVAYETAAAMMLQGMTVEYLFHRTYRVGPQTTMLFHAAAGGVGLIACQWARCLGATVIGTVSSDEKAELAKANGCTHTIVYTREDFVERVRALTGGEGVDVVYDSIGRDTYPKSLDCLKPLGLWVSFGNASGPVPNFDIGLLSKKGSLFATRPTLATYTAKRADLVASATAVMDMVAAGHVNIAINQTFALKDAAEAHRALEGRRTTGSTVLIA